MTDMYMVMVRLSIIAGEGLLNSSGKKWARNRRLLTRAFHFDVLKPYIRVYAEAADVLVVRGRVLLADG